MITYSFLVGTTLSKRHQKAYQVKIDTTESLQKVLSQCKILYTQEYFIFLTQTTQTA